MFSEAKNTKQQANVGLGVAIAYYSSKFYTVSIPLNDSQDYDLIVEKNGVLQRVQVKTSRRRLGAGYTVLLSMQGGSRSAGVCKRHTEAVYDILFALTADGARYEIPRQEIAHIERMVTLPGKFANFQIL